MYPLGLLRIQHTYLCLNRKTASVKICRIAIWIKCEIVKKGIPPGNCWIGRGEKAVRGELICSGKTEIFWKKEDGLTW